MRRLWVLVFLFAWFGLASAQGIRTVRGLAPGDVDGPASSIDSELALFDATTGKLLKGGSGITAPGSGQLATSSGDLTLAPASNVVSVGDGTAASAQVDLAHSGSTSWNLFASDAGETLQFRTSTTAVLSLGPGPSANLANFLVQQVTLGGGKSSAILQLDDEDATDGRITYDEGVISIVPDSSNTAASFADGGGITLSPEDGITTLGNNSQDEQLVFDNDQATDFNLLAQTAFDLFLVRHGSTTLGLWNTSGDLQVTRDVLGQRYLHTDSGGTGTEAKVYWSGPEGSFSTVLETTDAQFQSLKLDLPDSVLGANSVTAMKWTTWDDGGTTRGQAASERIYVDASTASLANLYLENSSGVGFVRKFGSTLEFDGGGGNAVQVRAQNASNALSVTGGAFFTGPLQVDRSGTGSEAFIAFGGPEGDASTHFGAVSGELESFELKLPDSVLGIASVQSMKWTTWDNSGTTQGQCASDRVQADQVFSLTDGVTAPATESGTAFIYVDSADGDLKVKFGDGFVAVIASDS